MDKDHGPFSNDEDKRTKLEEFLKHDFFRMLKRNVPIEPDDSVDELEYDSDSEPVGSGPDFEIEFEYKMEDEKTIRKMDFSIYDGDVKMHEWIEEVDGLGNGSYTLDVKEFENRLAELGIDLSIRTTEDDIEESERHEDDSDRSRNRLQHPPQHIAKQLQVSARPPSTSCRSPPSSRRRRRLWRRPCSRAGPW